MYVQINAVVSTSRNNFKYSGNDLCGREANSQISRTETSVSRALKHLVGSFTVALHIFRGCKNFVLNRQQLHVFIYSH